MPTYEWINSVAKSKLTTVTSADGCEDVDDHRARHDDEHKNKNVKRLVAGICGPLVNDETETAF